MLPTIALEVYFEGTLVIKSQYSRLLVFLIPA